ncbi:MAG: DUF1318 domain-containing protein [Pseudomonadota bacterium]
MKRHQKPLLTGIFCMILSIFACVTINIYFPAEKVESVAGEIVDDIRGRKPDGKKDTQSKNQGDSFLGALKVAISPSLSWAEEITTVSNPTIRALKEAMKTRFSQLKPYYQKGMLKEGDDGFVAPGDTSGLGLKGKRDLNNLLGAENKDRKTLYEEVAKALKIDSSQTGRIAEIFAKEWQKSIK